MMLCCSHAEYLTAKDQPSPSQRSLHQFALSSTQPYMYDNHHPRQMTISNCILTDLIIHCNLPISIVEHPNFRHFMETVDPKYQPMSRTSVVSSRIPKLVQSLKETISERLSRCSSVSTTVDIWSDRKMRSYMGVTAHTVDIHDSTKVPSLSLFLLCCYRIKGSHTGERIAEMFEKVVDEYKIKRKLNYIISDNAANMRKAFSVIFPALTVESQTQSEDGELPDTEIAACEDVDDADIWQDLDTGDQATVESTLQAYTASQRLSCFAHTEQLVIADGLKETRCAGSAIAKCSRISTLLHTSSKFRNQFEAIFGSNVGVPAENSTRWNSTLRQVKAVVALGQTKLEEMLEEGGYRNVTLTSREWSKLAEMIDILDPFLEATNITQGEKVVTITYALPCILSLNRHLSELKNRVKYCLPLVNSLHSSLLVRFAGLFERVKMTYGTANSNQLVASKPLGDDVYVLATTLDPKFNLKWIDCDVMTSAADKALLQQQVIGECGPSGVCLFSCVSTVFLIAFP